MRKALFLHTEADKDLIVGFALQLSDDPTDIETLCLQRCPSLEFALPPEEWGVNVSLESDDANELLVAIEFQSTAACVVVRTTERTYEINISKVDADEIQAMREVFKAMCFDQSFTIENV